MQASSPITMAPMEHKGPLSPTVTKVASMRYLDVQSLSRTSTCCTLSTYSSASDFSLNEDEDEENEAAHAAAEAASFYALRRNSSPEVYTYVPQPSSAVGTSGTFILYLIPSGKRARALNVARDYLGSLLGFDESHLYPLHCTLTSFFTVTSQDSTIDKDAIAANLATSLLTHIQTKFKVDCTATSPFDLECQRQSDGHTSLESSILNRHHGGNRKKPSMYGRRLRAYSETSTTASHQCGSSHRRLIHNLVNRQPFSVLSTSCLSHSSIPIKSLRRLRSERSHRRSTVADLTREKESHGRKTVSGSRLRPVQIRLPFNYSRKSHHRFDQRRSSLSASHHVASSTSFGGGSMSTTGGVRTTCSSCLFEVKHQPSRDGVQSVNRSEADLKNVFVTKDESVILPIQLRWIRQPKDETLGEDASDSKPHLEETTSSNLKDLCSSLQQSLLPQCVVSMPHRAGSKITAKAASHVALSSSKRRKKCSLSSVMAAARLYDSASVFEARSDFWDLALCELESWGSLDANDWIVQGPASAAKTTEGNRSLTPHVFREILRISRVGVTVH